MCEDRVYAKEPASNRSKSWEIIKLGARLGNAWRVNRFSRSYCCGNQSRIYSWFNRYWETNHFSSQLCKERWAWFLQTGFT